MCARSCNNNFLLLLLLAHSAFLLIPVTLHAASDLQEDIQQLETVVVTDTKTPTPISQVTSAVEVITAEDFKRRNDRTLVDALGLSQGIAIFSSGGPGTTSNVRIRGGRSDQTLVLIDGAIVNSATLGSFNFGTLTTENIESVTVLRGAQSMLWGSDAMGGVIDIRTKRGDETPVVRVFSEYGSFNSLREGGSFSGKLGPVDASLSISRWDMTKFSSINYRRGAGERDAFRNWQGSSLIGVDMPLNGRFEFAFRWINNDIDIDTSFGPQDVFKAKTASREFIYSGTYHQPMTDWWDQKLTLSQARDTSITQAGTNQRNIVTGNESTPGGFNNSDIRTRSNRIEWQSNFYIGKPVTVTVGYQFREQIGENKGTFTERIFSSHSGFAQMQLNLFDRFFATAGFRQDANSTFGDSTTYRVTGGYLLKETNTKFRASYATGFRAPDLNELYFPNFGNPDLKAEKSQNLDVGVEQFLLNKRVKLNAGYFWNRYRQLITTVVNDAAVCGALSAFNSCAQNIGIARTQGWEASGRIVVVENLPWLKRINLDGHYTYTSTKDLMTGTHLARWPRHQGSASLTYQPIDPLSLTGTFRYVGARFDNTGNRNRLPDFYIFNLSASYQVNTHIEVYTRVENLGNRKYEEIKFFGTPGRSIWGGVRVNFEIPILTDAEPNE